MNDEYRLKACRACIDLGRADIELANRAQPVDVPGIIAAAFRGPSRECCSCCEEPFSEFRLSQPSASDASVCEWCYLNPEDD